MSVQDDQQIGRKSLTMLPQSVGASPVVRPRQSTNIGSNDRISTQLCTPSPLTRVKQQYVCKCGSN